MVTRSFLEAHADAVASIREMFEEDPHCPSKLPDVLKRETVAPSPPEGDDHDAGDEPVETPWPHVDYYHVMSKIHLGRYLLEKEAVKKILAEEILHYARICEIEILHYSIMDNHFHLFVGVRGYSKALSKMMGCIKQQFTIKFKAWFNNVYRKENRYRRHALTNGTLWQGRCRYERIEDDAQFATCSLYIENNRLVVKAKNDIGRLDEPPAFQTSSAREHSSCHTTSTGWESLFGLLQPCYEDLLDQVKSFAFHSAPYYLGGCEAHQTYLTDGNDGIWASDGEVEAYFHVAANKLPEGWRKCWFKGHKGILKKPADYQRTYADNPFYDRLGSTDERRAAQYGRLLMGACYRKRHDIMDIVEDDYEPRAGLHLD
jgi:REP element-mobilizing transposase RayT